MLGNQALAVAYRSGGFAIGIASGTTSEHLLAS
jgi:hypothetical protein